jgi:hypothetical protein
MEVPYRRTKLLIKTIPKGTLLFRYTKTPQNDVRGIPVDSGRCVTPNFNVFFHPNPYIGYHLYQEYRKEIGDTVYAYVLTHDIKVLWLLEPSPYSRMTRKKKTFIKECSRVPKGCMPRPGNAYDPCFSDTMIKKYPDIVGMIALAPGDDKLLRKAEKRGITRKAKSYFHKARDSFGIHAVPELILHPFSKRPSKDVIIHENDKIENNYKLLKKMNYSEVDSFMTRAVYDPQTYFYTYKSSKSMTSSGTPSLSKS